MDGYETDCESCSYFLIKEHSSESNIESCTILSGFIDIHNDSCGVE